MPKIGLVFSMAKNVFSLGVLLLVWFVVVGCVVFVCLLHLEVLIVLWFSSVWCSCKFVKHACFPQLFGLLGGVLFVFIWVWKVYCQVTPPYQTLPFFGECVFLFVFYYFCLVAFVVCVCWSVFGVFLFALCLLFFLVFLFLLVFVGFACSCLFCFSRSVFCFFWGVLFGGVAFVICVCWSVLVLSFFVCFVIVCFGGLFLFLSVCFEHFVVPAILVLFCEKLVQCLFLIDVFGSCFLFLSSFNIFLCCLCVCVVIFVWKQKIYF